MILSTSDVAVCCSSDSERSSVRSRSSFSSRVFSMAMTACAAKFLNQCDLLLSERSGLHAANQDCPDRISFAQQRSGKGRSMPVLSRIDRSLRKLILGSLKIGNVDGGAVDHGSPRDPIPTQRPCGSHRPLPRWPMVCHAPKHFTLDTHDCRIGHVKEPCRAFRNSSERQCHIGW